MSRRFWAQAWAAPAEEGWTVLLDGKPMRLPSGVPLVTPHAALAEAIGAEWQAAGAAADGVFGAADVPLTGLAGTAQACVGSRREATVDALAAYAEADLLCYRVARPAGLAARQHAAWQPWLDWAERRHGALLRTTTALAHVAQPAASIAALRAVLDGLGAATLAAVGVAIPALGSCVLGLALADQAIDAAAAADCALIDEMYQQERWGRDGEAGARMAAIHAEIALVARFIGMTASVARGMVRADA